MNLHRPDFVIYHDDGRRIACAHCGRSALARSELDASRFRRDHRCPPRPDREDAA